MSRRQPQDVEVVDEEQEEDVIVDEDVEDFFEDDEKPADRRRDPLRGNLAS